MFGAKAEIAALEKGIAFELVMVPFEMKTLYQPKHPEVLRINPKRQVPVLVDEATSEWLIASATASRRECTPSLRSRFRTCVRAVE